MIKTQTNVYDSSTIESSTYDYKTKDLIVIFKHASYVYHEVKESDYVEFATADSQGKSLNRFIKQYKFTKQEE